MSNVVVTLSVVSMLMCMAAFIMSAITISVVMGWKNSTHQVVETPTRDKSYDPSTPSAFEMDRELETGDSFLHSKLTPSSTEASIVETDRLEKELASQYLTKDYAGGWA